MAHLNLDAAQPQAKTGASRTNAVKQSRVADPEGVQQHRRTKHDDVHAQEQVREGGARSGDQGGHEGSQEKSRSDDIAPASVERFA